MADSNPALLGVRARATRIAVETIKPISYRPPRYQSKAYEADQREWREQFMRTNFSFLVAYEIQARCGLHPLTSHEVEQLDERRRSATREDAGPLRDALQAASDKLIDAQSCQHCMMRGECAFRRGVHHHG